MGGGTQCIQSMCRYHGGVLSQYVHIGYITQARTIRRAFVADLLKNHHTNGPEHLMSNVEKKTVRYNSITM